MIPILLLSLLFSAASKTSEQRVASLAIFLALLGIIGLVVYGAARVLTRARYQLVVKDLPAARAELAERGVQTSEITVMVEGVDGSSFSYLADPDGNEWAIQEVREYVGAEL